MNIIDLVHRIGLQPKWVAGTAGGEYHSSCPECGGTDRFYIHPQKRMKNCYGCYRCRQCGIYGDSIGFCIKFLNYSFREACDLFGVEPLSKSSTDFINNKYFDVVNKVDQPCAEWIDRGNEFVAECSENILHNQEAIEYLGRRGIDLSVIQDNKIGLSIKNYFFPRSTWGLKIIDDNKKFVWIPSGIVIPTIVDTNTVKIKVRRNEVKDEPKYARYVCISGSMNVMTVIGNRSNKFMFVVESELDAFAIYPIVKDIGLVVSTGSSLKNPDTIVDKLAKNCKKLFIIHDNDVAGKNMFIKWHRFYPDAKAYPTPIGKDVGEAFQKRFDISRWLLSAV